MNEKKNYKKFFLLTAIFLILSNFFVNFYFRQTTINKVQNMIIDKCFEKNPMTKDFFQGLRYFQKKEYDSALNSLEKSISKTHKQLVLTHYQMGKIHMEQKNYDLALQKLNDAIELDSKFYDALQDRAVIFRLMGKYEESIEACQKILEQFPDHPITTCSLGWAYELDGQYEKAIQAYEKAIELAPDWDFSKQKLQNLKERMGK